MTVRKALHAESFQHDIHAIVDAIALRQPSPMQHEIWMRACALGIDPDGQFEIISANDRDRPVAAAAFAKRGGLAPCLYLLGAEEIWMPTDVHYKDENAAGQLAAALVKRGLPARFGHFPADSAFVEALKTASHGKAFVLSNEIPGMYFIPLDESWRAPEQKLRSKRRSDLRRRRKKAETLGAISFEILAPKPDEVDALIAEAYAVEASGWKGRSHTALAFDKKQSAFFQHYARLASEEGILRFCFLRINGKPAAATIAAECNRAFWQFKIGYDESYKECSPSKLLLTESVRYAANRGLSTYEFLGSAAWIEEWTTDIRPRIRLRFYPFNLFGAAAIASDGLAAFGRRAKDRLRLIQKQTKV